MAAIMGPAEFINGYLFALDTSDGSTRWKATLGGSVESSPVLATVNGTSVVIVGSDDGHVYAFPIACTPSCSAIWSFATGGPVISSPTVTTINGTPVVFIGSDDGNLYALTAASGAELWSFHTTGGSYHTGGPVVSKPALATLADGTVVVYFGSYDHNIYAVYASGANKGTLYWSYQTGDAVYSSPTVVALANGDQVLYIGSYDDNVYALYTTGTSAGQLYWPQPFATQGFVLSSPTEATLANGDQVVFVGSADGHLYAINAVTGQKYWNTPFATGSYIDSRPVVDSPTAVQTVYIGSFDHNIYAVAASTGAEIGSCPTGDAVYSSPALGNGSLYEGSMNYELYEYSAPCTQTPLAPLWTANLGKGSILSSPLLGP
jgi:outer membrane protein assembly factor BamB